MDLGISTDDHELAYSKGKKFRPRRSSAVLQFARSIVRPVCLLQEKKVAHCDLKPENLLLQPQKGPGAVKLIDFGVSCYDNGKPPFDYVTSRQYLAPEVVFGITYGVPIDMWALGCILAELILGEPLLPAENETELLGQMIELLGLPPNPMVVECRQRSLQVFSMHFRADGYPICQDGVPVAGLPGSQRVLANLTRECKNFISRCLMWDPTTRMTPKEAQKHPWIVDS